MKKILCMILLGLMVTATHAGEQTWCVFDPLGAKGDISRRLQDIRIYALQNHVPLNFKTFNKEKDAIQAFEQNKCSGLAASNFNTHRYNTFMGSSNRNHSHNFIARTDHAFFNLSMI